MKSKIISFLAIALLSLFAGCENISNNPSLIGTWEQYYPASKDSIIIRFDEDGFLEQAITQKTGMAWWTEGYWRTEGENLYINPYCEREYDRVLLFHVSNNDLLLVEDNGIVTRYRRL